MNPTKTGQICICISTLIMKSVIMNRFHVLLRRVWSQNKNVIISGLNCSIYGLKSPVALSTHDWSCIFRNRLKSSLSDRDNNNVD